MKWLTGIIFIFFVVALGTVAAFESLSAPTTKSQPVITNESCYITQEQITDATNWSAGTADFWATCNSGNVYCHGTWGPYNSFDTSSPYIPANNTNITITFTNQNPSYRSPFGCSL